MGIERRRRRRPAIAVAVTALVLSLGLAVELDARPAHAATDGMTASVTPSSVIAGSGGSFTLAVTDANASGASFTHYLLSGLPNADWVVANGGANVTATSTAPPVYSIPRAAAAGGAITITPPAGYSGTLDALTLTRVTNAPNRVTDFNNGTFDYVGTDRPQLPGSNTTYLWDDPTTLAGGPGSSIADCTNAQYGPCPGYYSIWPTAALHGYSTVVGFPPLQTRITTSAGHFNNRWADLRSVTGATFTAVGSAALCTNVATPAATFLNGTSLYSSTTSLTYAEAAASSKFLIVNGRTNDANNIIYTTVTGLTPHTYYSFAGSLANLTIESGIAPVSVQFTLQSSAGGASTLVGTSAPLPRQNGCATTDTAWVNASSVFYTGSSTTAIIGVRNNLNGSYGNDLAIDNLSLREMASSTFGLTVAPRAPGLRVAKTSSPGSGATVDADAEVTYTVTATNTGNVPLTGVVVTDTLTDVFDQAAYVAGSAAAQITPAATAAAPTVSGSTLTWTGNLATGAAVTLTYKVRVASTPGVSGELRNRVTATASDGGATVVSNCATGAEAGCFTTHPVVDTRPAHLTLVKRVVNDDGGSASADDFTLGAEGADAAVEGVSGTPGVTAVRVPAGTYTLSETGPGGYLQTDLSCFRDSTRAVALVLDGATLTLAPSETAFCEFTNDDAPIVELPLTGGAGPSPALFLGATAFGMAAALVVVLLYRARRRRRIPVRSTRPVEPPN